MSDPATTVTLEQTPKRGTSTWAIARRKLLRDPGSILAILVILTMVFVAVFAPVIAPWDPTRPDREVGFRATPPSETHILGTDQAGRDVLSRLIYGTRISLLVGFGRSCCHSCGIVFGLSATTAAWSTPSSPGSSRCCRRSPACCSSSCCPCRSDRAC